MWCLGDVVQVEFIEGEKVTSACAFRQKGTQTSASVSERVELRIINIPRTWICKFVVIHLTRTWGFFYSKKTGKVTRSIQCLDVTSSVPWILSVTACLFLFLLAASRENNYILEPKNNSDRLVQSWSNRGAAFQTLRWRSFFFLCVKTLYICLAATQKSACRFQRAFLDGTSFFLG